MVDNPWIPKVPSIKQRFFLVEPRLEVLYGGAGGGGKALAVDTPIPTPAGWKPMGELVPGDRVLGMDGKPVEVLAVSEVLLGRPCFRLTFDCDDEIVADADHRWLTLDGALRATAMIAKMVAPGGKANRAIPVGDTTRCRHIIGCEPVESVPVRCIQVAAADGMFLAGRSMVPTHNSEALLMAAAQFVDVPGYAALILRRTYQDLALPGALLDRSKSWWLGKQVNGRKATWDDKNKTWRFPGGGTITFGYLEHEDDKYRYASSEVQYLAFDELTTFTETQYTFLSSRLRRLASVQVPIRKRAATNPVGPGRGWVRKRFVPEMAMRADEEEFFSRMWHAAEDRTFIPARLEDNPHLDIDAYDKSLEHLDPVTKAQIRRGDWKAHAGGQFDPKWWKYYQDFGDGVSFGPHERHRQKLEYPRSL